MYLIFGTIYNASNVIIMQIVPQKFIGKRIINKLSEDEDLTAITWHIHPVGYSQDAKSGVNNIKTKLRSMNTNRTSNPKKRTKTLMPNAEKQMLDRFSAHHKHARSNDGYSNNDVYSK